tara:strand:- start:306 stop:458 length:153 start_codon:yes stop_codon:yes gene_type:complete
MILKSIKRYWLLILLLLVGGIFTYHNNHIQETEFKDEIDLITPIPEYWEP